MVFRTSMRKRNDSLRDPKIVNLWALQVQESLLSPANMGLNFAKTGKNESGEEGKVAGNIRRKRKGG